MGVLYFTIIPILLPKNNAYKERVPILSAIADSEQGAGSQIEEGREGGNGQEIEGFLIKHQQIQRSMTCSLPTIIFFDGSIW